MATHSLTPQAETSIFYLLLRFFILFHADFHGKNQHNCIFMGLLVQLEPKVILFFKPLYNQVIPDVQWKGCGARCWKR